MIRVRCPICGKSFKIAKLDDLPSFPFCSARCRLIDQGRWANGSYAVADPAPGQGTENSEDEVREEAEEAD